MRVLITGITGFVGGFLAEKCEERGWEVHGTSHPHHGASVTAAGGLPGAVARSTLHEIDLVDGPATAALVAAIAPDHVYHLAAQASVPEAWHDPSATLLNNIAAQVHVLEALRRLNAPGVRLLVVSTAEVYGGVPPEAMPIRESTPLQPLNPYAVSKATQDMLGYQYYRAYGLHIVRVRPFNHFGPRQRTGFVAADFAKQIAEIERDLHPPLLQVGNLSALRDFTDVRDIADAYVLALELGEAGAAYNICSGVGRPVRSLLDGLLAASTRAITVEPDPERMRPVDYPIVIGDAAAFQARTGWRPRIPFEQTVHDTLDYWRTQVVHAI
jgi:GDP-4-dehydro-6-deoxy-D-mannose reductase